MTVLNDSQLGASTECMTKLGISDLAKTPRTVATAEGILTEQFRLSDSLDVLTSTSASTYIYRMYPCNIRHRD